MPVPPPDDPSQKTAPVSEASGTATLEIATQRRNTEVMTTLAASSGSNSEPGAVDPVPVSFESGARYATRRLLGAGGMGEVRLCKDAWVGRDVAMKVMRGGSGSLPAGRARFLREARVQGQLEHPSVVPVYDLGHGGDGDFFTMKRVDGHTLEEIITALRTNQADSRSTFSRRKLLSAMSQVCLAVAFAHSRGVVHRDLKPANVMLGSYGEVYVLDWGVAKIAGAAELDLDTELGGAEGRVPQTEVGSVVGTPGYMSPEQARGENDRIGPASDIYSLGAILFELLALEPLHRGKTAAALIASTMTQAPLAPGSVAKDDGIAPELDEICLHALELDPAARFENARAMHDALERFLDGERDAERRRELAREHLGRARAHLARAGEGGAGHEHERSEGVRELSRALALDPADESALGLITELLTHPPAELPAEAEAELKAVELRDRATNSRRASGAYAAWLFAAPAFYLMGVKSWAMLILFASSLIAASAAMRWMGVTGNVQPRYMRVWFILNYTTIAIMSFLFGPFVFTPALASVSAAGYVVSIRANRQTRWLVFALSFLAVFVPAGLQLLHLLPASYAFEDGVIKILPVLVHFPAVWTPLLLAGTTAVGMVLPAILISRALENLIVAERKNFAQAWQLRQLLPKHAQPSVPPPAEAPPRC